MRAEVTARDAFKAEFKPERLAEIFNERILQSHTVGKDGIHPSAFSQNLAAELQRISDKATSGRYAFTTYKQRLVLKGPEKPPRTISVATVRDRVALRALTNVLMSIFPDARVAPAHYIVSEVAALIAPRGTSIRSSKLISRTFIPRCSMKSCFDN